MKNPANRLNGCAARDGFSAIELMIVMIIFALIMGTVFFAFDLYQRQQKISDTQESLDQINLALQEFKNLYGFYPCPADPAAVQGMPLYGREDRGIPWTNAVQPLPYRVTPCVASGQIKSVPGMDADNADGDGDKDTGGDTVLIGALPIMTLIDPDNRPSTNDGVIEVNLAESMSRDAWGRKFRYAVTERLTRVGSTGYNEMLGAIDIRDEHNQSILQDRKWAHAIVMSAGPDGRGAYPYNSSQLVQDCVTGVTAPTPQDIAAGLVTALNEIENCDDINGVFMNGLMNDTKNSYNDDMFKSILTQNGSLWQWVDADRAANVNPGNVGIGTSEPQQKLHVLGDITANRTHAALYGDTSDSASSEMPAAALGGDGATGPSAAMRCHNPGEVVTSIEKNRVNCRPAFTVTPQACPAGPPQLYLQGIRSTAGVLSPICCDPTATPGSATACN